MAPLPCSTMRGTACEAQRKNPLRWVAITDDQSANEIWPISPTRWMPALLTRIPTGPKSLSTAAKPRRHAVRAGHVDIEIEYARPRLGRGDLVERGHPRPGLGQGRRRSRRRSPVPRPSRSPPGPATLPGPWSALPSFSGPASYDNVSEAGSRTGFVNRSGTPPDAAREAAVTWSTGAGLEGKGVVVTGAGGGIGREVAIAFASAGAQVALSTSRRSRSRRCCPS